MGDFWYNNIKARYGDKASLLYTDTNSLLFQVETEDAYKDIYEYSQDYDFSENPGGSPYYSTENKNVVV